MNLPNLLLNWIYRFLLDITYAELWPNHHTANILGLLWLIALMTFAYWCFSWHFQNSGWPQPSHGSKRILWVVAIVGFAFVFTFLLQIVTDELIVVPFGIAYGSWNLLSAQLGSFTIWKLIGFKWDSYMLIIVYSGLLFLSGAWKFLHFTKQTLFWLIVIVAFSFWLNSSAHIFYFLNLTGWARIRAFYLSYPVWRILIGFLGASIIKKPGVPVK
jgi:hypothetical protein